jgi:hypothetical protein
MGSMLYEIQFGHSYDKRCAQPTCQSALLYFLDLRNVEGVLRHPKKLYSLHARNLLVALIVLNEDSQVGHLQKRGAVALVGQYP